MLCGASSAFETAIKPGMRVRHDPIPSSIASPMPSQAERPRVVLSRRLRDAQRESLRPMLITLRKWKRDQIDFQKYDWDSTARMIEWVYYGGYQTPSEKMEARKKGGSGTGVTAQNDGQQEDTNDIVGTEEMSADELKKADLKLHFGIVKIARDFKMDALLSHEKTRIFEIMACTPDDTPTLVLYLDLLHRVASDDELMSYAAAKVTERLSDLIGNPLFETLWLPGSFYKIILEKCQNDRRTQEEVLIPAGDEKETHGDPVVKRNAFYDSLVNLK